MILVEYLAQTLDHHRRSKDPAVWFSVGFSLYFAANVLWERLRPALNAWQPDVPLTDAQELALRLRGPFAMLAGMAIEVMLKGAIVQAMPVAHRKAPPTGHNLKTLSETAKVTWTADQTDLLERLTTFIVWAGRYPVGLSEKETNAPRTLKSTDYVRIVEIASHLFQIHQGSNS